jgi:hypothetical protein
MRLSDGTHERLRVTWMPYTSGVAGGLAVGGVVTGDVVLNILVLISLNVWAIIVAVLFAGR